MRIMVFDVPAESGGALSVLHDFYKEYEKDKDNEYIFVVSKPELPETSNIKVLKFPWIKKSWVHRLYFDHLVAGRLIKKYKIDRVLSLQNIIIPHAKLFQSVYIHNSLPFVEYRFSLKQDKLLWIYQNIVSKFILKSIKNANEVFVQTEWMKNACINKLKINQEKVKVISPRININVTNYYKFNDESVITFFYPASGLIFKNHKVIVEACKCLKKLNISNYKVIFTLDGHENRHILMLYEESIKNELPIEYIGTLNRQEVFDFYTKSILIFPSYIETYGLPLLEAKLHKSIILASKYPFSYEVLKDYNNVLFFDAFDSTRLAELMQIVIEKKFQYVYN